MMIALPLFFVVILFRYPAGLLLYWIVTNLWTVAQGYFVRRNIGAPPVAPGKGAGPPGSGDSPNGRSGGSGGRGGEPALAGVGVGLASAPPPPPRKKKKRSGKRR
jgi:YidC/Oxa1 family membrane protein insertase